MNDLMRKHGAGALAGATGGGLSTLVALFIGWQTMQTRDNDVDQITASFASFKVEQEAHVEELKAQLADYGTLTVQIQANAATLASIQEKQNEANEKLAERVREIEKTYVTEQEYDADQNKVIIELRSLSTKFDGDMRNLRRDIESDYNRRMDKLESALFENARSGK